MKFVIYVGWITHSIGEMMTSSNLHPKITSMLEEIGDQMPVPRMPLAADIERVKTLADKVDATRWANSAHGTNGNTASC